jgi:hypothetical protein
MVTNFQSIEVALEPQSTREIEHFVDTICDQLFINDAYYGNILISVTTFFEELTKRQEGGSISITYSTDHQEVNITFQPVENQLVKTMEKFSDVTENIENEIDKLGLVMNTLVDHIDCDTKEKVTLAFDISALHNDVYRHRQRQLNDYFNHTIEAQLKKSDDQL